MSAQITAMIEDGYLDDGPECPFCGDLFEVTDERLGTVFGHCDRCREMVAVEVAIDMADMIYAHAQEASL